MAWLKIETHTPDKPEIFDIASQLGIDSDAVFGKCFRVWVWFDAHTTNGKANGVPVSGLLVDRIAGVTGFAEAMRSAGWLLFDGEGYAVPNFDRHNGETAKQRALTAKRVAKHLRKDNDKTNADGVMSALPREEKIREEVNLNSMSGKPDTVTHKGINGFKPQAIEVLNFLNTKTGRNYQPVEANLKLIAARLKEGASVSDCRAVVAKKAREWGADEKMEQYLRPATLFNATKFAQYRGELVEAKDD